MADLPTEPPDRRRLVHERIAAVRETVAERGAGGALLSRRGNVAWATLGAEAHVVLASEQAVASLLVTDSGAALLTAVNEAPRIEDEELAGLDLEVVALPWHEADAIVAEARRRVGGEPLDDTALEADLVRLRGRLTPAEAERIEWLSARARDAALGALAAVRAGMTEHEVAAEAGRALAVEGVRAPVLLAAADDRIERYRHPIPTARRIERRVMMVIVAERWGLHAAVTRFAELVPPDAELARRIASAAEVHDVMVRATRPGSTLGAVIAAAQAAYAAAGHPDEWRLHHQGGIIGYAGRERIATPDDPTPIEAGMAFAWNPSIAGAKAEETILLDDARPRVLTR